MVAANQNKLQQTEQLQMKELRQSVGKVTDSWNHFIFFINVKTGPDVRIEYRLPGQLELKPLTSKYENVGNVLKDIGKNFGYLKITFEGDYSYAKEISEFVNLHCRQAQQTVKLLGQIGEDVPAFTYATQVILAELTYSERFDLPSSFPKMTALTMFKCRNLLILKKRIPNLNDLTIHFPDARISQNTQDILIDFDFVQNAINIVRGIKQITRLKIMNREITLEQMKQVASLPILNELDLNWMRRTDFPSRVEEFLGSGTTLERFNLTANTGGDKFSRVHLVIFHRFVNELADYLVELSKMKDKNMVSFTDGELTTTATFCLKVFLLE